MMHSALYSGLVTHRRTRPVTHALRYRVFMLLLDLDEAPALARGSRVLGFDGARLLSLHQKDHGDGGGDLRGWADAHLRAAGYAAGGAIRILCMPRVFGMSFNPLTLFFCHGADGELQAVLYQVNNTFGQRHCYLLPASGTAPIVQECGKDFHVSPFLGMALRYRFRVMPPAKDCAIGIHVLDERGIILTASFAGARVRLTDAALLRAMLALPLQGVSVLAAIHWEAFRLWRKGLRLQPAPRRPATAISVQSNPGVATS